MSTKFDRNQIQRVPHKVARQRHGGPDSDDLINANATGRFAQGMPNGDPVPSFQNSPVTRKRTQAPGGGAPGGSYQGRGDGADGSHASYLSGASMAQGQDFNNLAQTTRMQALVKAIRNRLMVTANNRGK